MATCTVAEAEHIVNYFMSKNIPSFLWGDPGIGKTQLIEQIFAKLKQNVMFLDLSTLESIDLRGLPAIDLDKELVKWIPPELLPNEKRDGKKGCLFMDELNVAHPSIQAACMPLVREGRIGTWKKPKGWYIVGAGNYQSSRASAQKMPTALADRFGHAFVEADPETWTAWANENDINPLIVAFIRFRPELLHKMDEHEQIVFPTPRSWEQASKVCDAPDGIRSRLMSGLVGDGASAEYEGYFKTFMYLPTIEEIIKNPKTTMVPTEPSAKYAVSTAIARKATRENFSAVMTYAERLDREFEIITGLDATRRDPDLCDHKAFIDFAKRNQDIQI